MTIELYIFTDFFSGRKSASENESSTHLEKTKNVPYFAWICLFAACAMLSKEHGITVLGVCFVAEIVYPYQTKTHQGISKTKCATNLRPSVARFKEERCDKRKMTMFWLVLTTIVLIILRLYVMGGTNGTPSFASADNPAAADKSFLTRTLTFIYLPSFNLVNLLMCPNQLSFDWSMEAIPLIESICDIRNVVTVTTMSVIFFLVVKLSKDLWKTNFSAYQYMLMGKRSEIVEYREAKKQSHLSPTVLVSLAIIILPFIPATNLFFYVGFVVAERVLYIPSMGYCILVGCGLRRLWKIVCNLFLNNGECNKRSDRKNRLVKKVLEFQFVLFTCVVFATLGLKTMFRNRDWLNEETLYRSGVKINPPKGRTLNIKFM